MLYQLFKAERGRQNQSLINDALIAMHFCEEKFNLSSNNTPFTTETVGRVTTISIDDTYQHYANVVDTFTAQMDKRKAYRIAQAASVNKTKAKKHLVDARMAMVCSILQKTSDEVLFHEKSSSITISIKGNHSYTADQMRKLCTLFKKHDPVFTCRSNHFIITITVNNGN
jgi:hypothetical protein